MQITIIGDGQANLELTDLEISVFYNMLVETKNDLNHKPGFQTRVGVDYSEAEELIRSLNSNCIVDLEQVTLIGHILNEGCNGIRIDDFDTKIGIPKVEAKSYLRAFNKLMNQLRD
jgi:hypothetical protein